MRERVAALKQPPSDLDARGAFIELQGVEDYAGERCDLAELDVGLLSLPAKGFKPKAIDSLMGPGGAEFVQHLVNNIILPKEQQARAREELGLARPYQDPRLRSSKVMRSLLRRLSEASLLEFSTTDGVRVGIFTVW